MPYMHVVRKEPVLCRCLAMEIFDTWKAVLDDLNTRFIRKRSENQHLTFAHQYQL